jgi:hypothetical protein
VAERPGYAVEAADAGAPAAAAAFLASPAARASGSADDDDQLDDRVADLVAAVIAACGGEAAAPACVRTLTFPTPDAGPPLSVSVAQGSLSDGIGARLWASATALGRALADPDTSLPPAVHPPPAWAGAAVLELGAGVGLVSMLLPALGALSTTRTLGSDDGGGCGVARVDVTDGDGAALATLRRTLASNAGAWGEEEGGTDGCWEAGVVRVRRLVWAAAGDGQDGGGGAAKPETDLPDPTSPSARGCTGSLRAAGAAESAPPLCPACARPPTPTATTTATTAAPFPPPSTSPLPPDLPADARYGLVLAADCLYEPEGAAELAEEVCARLDPGLAGGGVALLAGPVRDGGETLAAFVEGVRARGGSVTVADAPEALAAAREAGDGVAGRPGEYDRFVFVRVQAPAAWAGRGAGRGGGGGGVALAAEA